MITDHLFDRARNKFFAYFYAKGLADVLYTKYCGGRHINWKYPIDLNEKINWLKFYSDTSEWTILADKYRVREFVKQRVGDEFLVPLYGMWVNPNEVDFSVLPSSFVIKPNNGAGEVMVVRDKSKLDEYKARQTFAKWQEIKFGKYTAEPHYLKIKPCIIAEKLLEQGGGFSSSLIDYKIWCFDGKVFGTWACFNRVGFHADTEWHDLDWNFRPEWSIFTESYRNGGGALPEPKNYQLMIDIASKLSKGFPEVRIDLYNIDGHIFFGEMTFTCAGGYMNFYSDDVLKKMGDLTEIQLNND